MFMRLAWFLATFALVVGCADFDECPDGGALQDGECVAPVSRVTKQLQIGCGYVPSFPTLNPNPLLPVELTIEAEDIVAGELFAVGISGKLTLDFLFLQGGIRLFPFSRFVFADFRGTVRPRSGATGEDVELRIASFDPPSINECTYDADGRSGFAAGPFPTCSLNNDLPDGSNSDCVGLGGAPNPDNPCQEFVHVPLSFDCSPGGECDQIGRSCEGAPACVTDEIDVILTSVDQAYRADSGGSVLFGLADGDSAEVTIRPTGPNAGTWAFSDDLSIGSPLTANGAVFVFNGTVPSAAQCTMAVESQGPCGVNSLDRLTSPTPDEKLIAFPIRVP